MNLAGVEIILNMREKMEEMQRQIEEFVHTLNTEFATHMRQAPPRAASNSLIPVVKLPRPRKVNSGS